MGTYLRILSIISSSTKYADIGFGLFLVYDEWRWWMWEMEILWY